MIDNHLLVGITRAANTVMMVGGMAFGIAFALRLLVMSDVTIDQKFSELSMVPHDAYWVYAVAAAIAALDQQGIARLEREGQIELDAVEGGAVVALSDVEIISEDMPGWIVANEGNITVALDVTLTPELLNEGRAREIINRIQNIRKNRNYDITDRIKLVFEPSGIVDGVLAGYADYIGRQVLAEAVVAGAVDASSETVEVLAIDDAEVKVDITLN